MNIISVEVGKIADTRSGNLGFLYMFSRSSFSYRIWQILFFLYPWNSPFLLDTINMGLKKKKDMSAAYSARWSNRRSSREGDVEAEEQLLSRNCGHFPDRGLFEGSEALRDVRVDSVIPLSTRNVQQLPSGLYLVDNPNAIICKRCLVVVMDPIRHLQGDSHRADQAVIDLVEEKLKEIDLNNTTFHAAGVMEALPFIEVIDGWKCRSCGKCTEHAKNLGCCDVWRSTAEVEKVRLQRCIGRGSVLRAVEVTDVKYNLECDSNFSNAVENVLNENSQSTRLVRDSVREMNLFYQKMKWFTDEGAQLQEILDLNLHQMFLPPEGVTEEWHLKLVALFLAALKWAHDLPKSFLDFMRFRALRTERTMLRYATAFTRVFYFVLNLRRNPIQGAEKMNVCYPFERDFEELLRSDPGESVFDLCEALMSETIDSRHFTLIDVILRIHCVDPVKKDLKDPTNIQTTTAPLLKLFHLAALVQGHRASGSSNLFDRFFPDEEVLSISEDALKSSFEQDDFDDDVYEIEDDDEVLEIEESEEQLREMNREALQELSKSTKTNKALRDELMKRRKLITKGNLMAIETIIDVKNLSRAHGYPRAPRINRLSENKICFNSTALDISNLQKLPISLALRVQKIFEELSMGVDVAVELEDMAVDSISEDCIRMNESGKKKFENCLRHHILSKPELTEKFVDAVVDKKVFFSQEARKWLEKLEEVEEILPVLVHLSGGMPGRATELETYRFRSSESIARHLFLFDGSIYFAPSYRKTQSMQADDLGQYRFLPKWLTLLLLRLFLVFRPFADELAKSCIPGYRGDYVNRVFVSRGKPMSDRTIRNLVSFHLSRAHFPLTFGQLRHVIKFLFNEGVSKMVNKGGVQAEHVVVLALNIFSCVQFNHSPGTGRSWYGLVQGEAKHNKIEFVAQRGVSQIWHDIMDIARSPEDRLNCGDSSARSVSAFLSELMKPVSELLSFCAHSVASGQFSERTFLDLKASVTSMLSKSCLPTALLDHQMHVSEVDQFSERPLDRRVAVARVASTRAEPPSKRRKIKSPEEETLKTEMPSGLPATPNPFSRFSERPLLEEPTFAEVLQAMKQEHEKSIALRLLRKLLGTQTNWKSQQQEEATLRSIFSDRGFLCVLPTGGGKSPVFLLAALHRPDLITFVLVPTIAVQDDIRRRATESGVNVSFELNERSKGLVILTYNKVQSSDEHTGVFLISLIQAKRVFRVFFDEAHTLLTDEFRDPLQFLPALATRIPVVLLTATASTAMAKALKQLFLFDSLPDVRAGTDRPNIAYEVRKVKMTKKSAIIAEDAGMALRSPLDRVIVFCPSRERVAGLSEYLAGKGLVVHSITAEVDREQRTLTVGQWMHKGQVMVATSAFGAGVDYPYVRLVILDGLPHSMVDYVQMCGRAGRNGASSKAVLLFDSDSELQRVKKMRTHLGESRLEFMLSFADSTEVCRREFITFYFDGVGVPCGSDEYRCDICTLSKSAIPKMISVAEAAKIDFPSAVDSLPGPEYGELKQSTSVNPRIATEVNLPDAEEVQSLFCRLERVVTDNRDNLLTLQKAEVAELESFISANKESCGKCLIEGRPHNHNAPECKFVQSAKCEFCLDIPLFPRDCQRWCPFKPYPKQACAGCWLPNYIGDQAFHKSVNFSSLKKGCVFFSIKLFLIRSRYLELTKSTIGTEANAIKSQMEKDYSKWIGQSNGLPTGLCIFVREVLPKLKSFRIDRVE